MNYKYQIEMKRSHGIEVYHATLLHLGVVIASTTSFSHAGAKTWAILTHRKLVKS